MKSRKKPVVIEAEPVYELLGRVGEWSNLPGWFIDAYEEGTLLLLPRSIEIATLEGRMTAGWDDWLIQGVKGEIYPCKPDIFDATYEPVEALP